MVVVLVILRSKPAIRVKHRGAFLELHARDLAVLDDDALRAPAVVDRDAFLRRLLDLVGGGRHFFRGLEAVHGHGGSVRADSRPRDVHRDVAAADDHDLAADVGVLAQVDPPEEIDTGDDAFRVLAVQAELPAALCADGDIEGLKTLRAKLAGW